MKVFVLEDDKNIRELVVYTLEHFGYEATGFEFPQDFWEHINRFIPDVILLDILLPQENGLEVLKKIRSNPKYSSIPVIILSAKESEYDRVLGLDCGADDYVPKPFGMMELVARIRAVTRRINAQKGEKVLEYDDIKLSTTDKKVVVDGELIDLRPKEYEVLNFLMQNRGVILTREQILNKVWGPDFVGTERAVDVQIRKLREKIGERAAKHLITIRGFGYLFGDK